MAKTNSFHQRFGPWEIACELDDSGRFGLLRLAQHDLLIVFNYSCRIAAS